MIYLVMEPALISATRRGAGEDWLGHAMHPGHPLCPAEASSSSITACITAWPVSGTMQQFLHMP